MMKTNYLESLKEFSNFLASAGVMDVTKEQLYILTERSIRDFLTEESVKHEGRIKMEALVPRLFRWDETIQGEAFWREINRRWIKHLLNNQGKSLLPAIREEGPSED